MSIQSALADYDMAKRLAAREQGSPITRASMSPVMVTAAETYARVWTHNGSVVVAGPDGVTKPFDVKSMLDYVLGQIVFDTHATLTRLVAQVGVLARDAAPGDWDARSLWSSLNYTRSLSQTHRIVVLTRALSDTFYIDPSFDTESLSDWATALGIVSGDSTPERMRTLVSLLSELGTGDKMQRKFRAAAISAELRGVKNAMYGGLLSSNAAFKAAQSHTDAVNTMIALDPLQIERNVLARRLSLVEVTLQTSTLFGVTLPDSFGIREGKSVIVMNPEGHAEKGTLLSIDLRERNGQMLMEGSIRGRFGGPIGAKVLTDLYVCEEPFLATPRHQGRRWALTQAKRAASPDYNAPEQRQVPLEIVLAGAPVTD